MSKITPEHIKKLNNKVKCTCCQRILFEGVIERGVICVDCPSCGTSNTFMITGEQKERFHRNDRSIVTMMDRTLKAG